jgi:hypothetical protein
VSANLKVTGLNELQATLRRFASPSDLAAAARPEMNRVGAKVLKRSVDLTPRDRGGLVNSANLQTSDNGLTVTLGYNTPYARRTHENPRAGHTGGVSPRGQRYKHFAAVGEYKFLEKAMQEAAQTAWPDVARGLESWLRSQGR